MEFIVAFDKNLGIGINNKLPWHIKKDMEYFNKLTFNTNIVMGMSTYLSIPDKVKPLTHRYNIVLTNKNIVSQNKENLIYTNLKSLDFVLENSNYKKTMIIGGSDIYKLFMDKCDIIYATLIDKVYDCDKFFPHINNEFYVDNYGEKHYDEKENVNFRFIIYKRKPIEFDEKQYINHISYVQKNGITKDDRTGVGTISVFGTHITFDISDNIPILTTKRMAWKSCIEELLWFMRGESDAKILQKRGVKIWDGNTSREYLDKIGLNHYKTGDAGANYSFQWRHFGAKYIDCETDYTDQGFDQIEYIMNLMKNEPNSRRIVLSGWNPCDLNKTALPCCHMSAQWIIENNNISCMMTQRSQDVFLGAPFNILSYAVMTYIFALKFDYKPNKLIINVGDTHIYLNHINQINEQLKRAPYPRAKLHIDNSVKHKNINDITINDFDIIGYLCYPSIKADMAV